ncbi:hypothetical protein [Porticoccus sp.]|uniref:hypothetical protein n=1 Tax=Porticoccus sp. TaxID=2024853 RepID=UPI003F6A186B
MSSILFEKKRVDVNRSSVRLTAILVGLCLSFYWQALPYFQQDMAVAASLNRWLLPGLFSAGAMLASGLAVFFIRLGDWRRLVLIGGLGSAFALLAAALASGALWLMVCHGLAGLFAGLGLSVVVSCLGDTVKPVSSFAWALFVQALMAAGLTFLVPSFAPGADSEQVLLALAGLAFLTVLLSRLLPTSGAKRLSLLSSRNSRADRQLLQVAIAGLLIFLGCGLFWSSHQLQFETAQPALGLGASAIMLLLLARVFGALLGAILAARRGFLLPVGMAGVLVLVAVVLLQIKPDRIGYLTAYGLLGATGFFAAAYLMGLLAKLDSSGRFSPLILAIPLLAIVGAMMVSAMLVSEQSLPWLPWSGVVFWALGFLFYAKVVRANRQLLTDYNAVSS